MDTSERQHLLNIVAASLRYAESKHPAFASMISRRAVIPGQLESYRNNLAIELERVRKGNNARESVGRENIEDLLREEILEALEAFYRGDYIGAKQEFSQVAAVAIRAMSWVDKFSSEHSSREKYKRGQDVK